MANLNFRATDHDTTQNDYENLPNGIYVLQATETELKDARGGGEYVKVVNEVLEPQEYNGRKLFMQYNINNKSTQAEEIGRKQFASLCRAVGKEDIQDTDEICFIGYTARVGLGKPSKDGQYAAKNEIKRYYFPDEDDNPEPAIDENQPAPPAANNNKPQRRAANDNKSPSGSAGSGSASSNTAAGGGKSRPWGNK